MEAMTTEQFTETIDQLTDIKKHLNRVTTRLNKAYAAHMDGTGGTITDKEISRQVFMMREAGLKFKEIAGKLEAMGIRSPKGNKAWSVATVWNIYRRATA